MSSALEGKGGRNYLRIACWNVPVDTSHMYDSPHLTEVCHVAVEGTEWKMPAVPGILPQPTAGHTLPGYCLPQRVCSRERCEAGIPCDFCWWMVNVMPSQHGDSVGNAGSLQVAQKLRAGDLWAGLCAVWAMGVGLRLQLSAGAGKVRTSNWAFGFQF